jgi:hypothetical protein
MSSARPAIPGDICVLLAPSRPLSERASRLVKGMRATFGGEVVQPLHVTVDRLGTETTDELIRAVRESLPWLRPVVVRVDRVFFVPSRERGPEVLKLDVVRDAALDHDLDELRGALRRHGLPSLHTADRSTNISTLQRVSRPASAAAQTWDLPLELFVGDLVLVSRISGPATYEILDTAHLSTSG